MRQPRAHPRDGVRRGLPPTALLLAILTVLVLAPTADGRHGLCVQGDYGPGAFTMPSGQTEAVDVTFHDEPDFQQRLVSYRGTLHVTWLTEEEDPEVTEYLFMRALGPEGWGPKVVVNNPNPEEGEFHGSDIRVAGYDAVVHDGLLWFAWSTPSPEQADGTDGDIVYRIYDGASWGPIQELTAPGDEAIDITPDLASSGDRLVATWTTSTQGGRRIVASSLEGGEWLPPVPVTSVGDGGDDFNPRVAPVPGGAFLAWHHRDPASGQPTQVTIRARVLAGDELGPTMTVSGADGAEDMWFDLRWHVDRLMMVWQRTSGALGPSRSQIMYREWTGDAMGPETDITGAASGGFNGRPAIGLTTGGPRVYWHTNDDGVTLGSSHDLVWRGRDDQGRWGPVEVFQSDPGQDMVRVRLVEHGDGLWAAWMGNVTFQEPPTYEPHQAWDVFVAPANAGGPVVEDGRVWLSWENCEDGPERTRLLLQGGSGPLSGVPVEVRLTDPEGEVEAVLTGTTDARGSVEFDHRYAHRGDYIARVTLEDGATASVPIRVEAVPEHPVIDPTSAILAAVALLALALAAVVVVRRVRGGG